MGTLGCGPGPLGPLLWKNIEKKFKMDAKMETFFIICVVFVESDKQRLDCACAVGLKFGSLDFNF